MTIDQTAEDRRLGGLLRSATTDLVALVRGEVALARSEAKDTMRQVVVALVSLIAGALIAFAALLVLLQALIIALSHVMPPWAASVLVGVVVAIIGFILIRKGESDLSAAELAPTRTTKSLRKDASLLKEQVT
jgi:uncharacterized membrane protein YqjE